MIVNKEYIINSLNLILVCAILSSGVWSCSSQKHKKLTQNDIELTLLANTPKKLTESSGLVFINGKIYTHNDSGDKPRLYQIDTLGNIQKTIKYKELDSEDWESITASDKHVYIGDFGNNDGDRKDLVIYKLPLEDINDEKAEPEKLKLKYKKQEKFKFKEHQHPYDMEAMEWIEDNLYLFSKDWTTFTSTIYRIDTDDDKQKLESYTNVDTGFVVTDAAYNKRGRLVLIGYDSVLQPYLAVLAYKNGNFELEQVLELGETPSQMEAITHIKGNDKHDKYLITSEATNVKIDDNEAYFSGAVYMLKISK